MENIVLPETLLRKNPAIAEALDKVATNEASYAEAKTAVQRIRGEKTRLHEVREEVSDRAVSLVQRYAGGDLEEADYREQLVALGAEAAAADVVLQQMPVLEGWADSRMTSATKAKIDHPVILGKIGTLKNHLAKIRDGEAPDYHTARLHELAGILGLDADELLAAAGVGQ